MMERNCNRWALHRALPWLWEREEVLRRRRQLQTKITITPRNKIIKLRPANSQLPPVRPNRHRHWSKNFMLIIHHLRKCSSNSNTSKEPLSLPKWLKARALCNQEIDLERLEGIKDKNLLSVRAREAEGEPQRGSEARRFKRLHNAVLKQPDYQK